MLKSYNKDSPSTDIRCIVCGNTSHIEASDIFTCTKCRFLSSRFPSGYGTGVDGLENLRKSNFETLLDFIALHKPIGDLKILEIGCSKGWFLDAAASRGALVYGVEPETENAEIARISGHSVEIGLFPDYPKNKGPYDLIVFNDVFEHIPQQLVALRAVQSLLRDNGLAVFNIPSSDGTLYRIASALNNVGITDPFDRLWQKGMASPHVSYFSPQNLKQFVEKYSDLRLIGSRSLPSVSRTGLKERVTSQSGGMPWQLSYAAVWVLSFVLPILPADIHVGIYEKKC